MEKSNTEQLKQIASQLRKPEGEMGIQIGTLMNTGNERMNKNVIELLHPVAGDRILEVGMGNGFFIKDIIAADHDITYIGCDFSALMVAQANTINAEYIRQGKVLIHHASADKLPVPGASVNKLFTVNTLYFWENPSDILAEIRRVLRDDGQLYIAVRPKYIMDQMPMTQYGFTKYEKDDIVRLLTDNAYRVTDIIERQEPDQELMGALFKLETLVVVAKKV